MIFAAIPADLGWGQDEAARTATRSNHGGHSIAVRPFRAEVLGPIGTSVQRVVVRTHDSGGIYAFGGQSVLDPTCATNLRNRSDG